MKGARFRALEDHSVDSERLIKGTLVFLASNYLAYGGATVFPGGRDILMMLLLSGLWLGYFEFVGDVLSGTPARLVSIFRAFQYSRWRDFTDLIVISLTYELVYTLRFLLPYMHQQEGAAAPISAAFAFVFGIYPAHLMQESHFGIPRFLRFIARWFRAPHIMFRTALRFWLVVIAGVLALGIGILWSFPLAVKEALRGLNPPRTPEDLPSPSG